VKVLVTGSAGYIGCAAVPVLEEAGHEVVGLDTDYYRGCDLSPPPAPTRLDLDVRDVTPDDLRGIDAVVHLAALSNDPIGDLDRELTLEINHRASVRLAQAAKDAGVEWFVFSSSCSMYGASGADDELDEDAPLRPLTAYAESKVRAEEEIAGLADDGFAPVFMRNATAYGVSPRLRLDLVLNNLVAWAHTTGRVRILSDGTSWRPLVHVEDISRAALAALEAPADVVRGEAFNVGSSAENHQVRGLAEIVRDIVGDCTVEFAPGGDRDPRSYRVSFAKLERELPAFRARWTARDGAAELIDAYRGAGLDLATFEGPTFTRLLRLRELLESGELSGDLRWRAGRPAVAAR
jgi:nucleoside-diphosphate-sugar epimerase